MFDSAALCLGVSLPNVQTLVSPCQKGKSALPKLKVEPITPSKKALRVHRILRLMETEPYPPAVPDGRTKINVPLFNRFRHTLPQNPPQHLQDVFQPQPHFLFILVRISVFTAGGCAPPPRLPCSWDFFSLPLFFVAVSKSKRLALFFFFLPSEEAICSGENETCEVSRAGPAVGRRRWWGGAEAIPD